MKEEPRGWHYRGYLPHFDRGEIAQFVTFRVAGRLRGEAGLCRTPPNWPFWGSTIPEPATPGGPTTTPGPQASRPQKLRDDVADLRREYTRGGLKEDEAHLNPVDQFRKWFEEALAANLHEPNAMTLATTSSDGRASARVVLLKGFDERGFVFYTNYEGRKARDLEENPYCALVFYWGELERQVRVEGSTSRVSAEESDEYYRSRPRGSQLSAWASEQSRPVVGRDALEARLRRLEDEYEGRNVPRPPFWGGYRVEPEVIEFWQGRENRLHDRLLYRCSGGDGAWSMERLQP